MIFPRSDKSTSIGPPSIESRHFPTETLTAQGPTVLGRRIHASHVVRRDHLRSVVVRELNHQRLTVVDTVAVCADALPATNVKLPCDVLIHLPKMLGCVEPAGVGRPSPQYRVQPVQLLLQRWAVVTADSRFHLVPDPLHGMLRWPAVIKPSRSVSARGLFPKAHTEKVKAVLGIDDANLAFMDSHPQPPQELLLCGNEF